MGTSGQLQKMYNNVTKGLETILGVSMVKNIIQQLFKRKKRMDTSAHSSILLILIFQIVK
jgi:hypothetical protein